MVTTNVNGGASLLKLGGECAGLNLMVAGLAVVGTQLGSWLADADGSGIGLLAGLVVGLIGHTVGSGMLADRQSRD